MFLWIFTGCAAAPVQSNAFLKAPRTIPEVVQIGTVPFIEQARNQCGPAALTMALNWAGRAVNVDEFTAETYTPGKSGSLQADLVGAARRNGMLAVPLQGVTALLTELAAGHPVIVLQNLAFRWLPKWHYAVAIGYDLGQPELLFHSGSDALKKTDLRKFESTWALADYWGLVVLAPGQLAATADDLAHSSAAASLEQIGKNVEAEEVYSSVLKRWPESRPALIGRGNTRYSARDYKSAVKYLEEATHTHPDSSIAWHNLATAQGAAGMRVRARLSARTAIEKAGDVLTRENYRSGLAEWLEE